MLKDLISFPSSASPAVASSVRPEARMPTGSAGTGASVAAARAAEGARRHVVEPTQALDRATRLAARAMFKEREVEVTNFHDRESGRIVCKVADRSSGEVLMQSPPDALLRFFASTRDALAAPLLAVDA